MSELREYRVEATGRAGAIPATVLLSDEDAEKQGLTSKDLVRGGLKIADTEPEIDARTTYADATPVTAGTDPASQPTAVTAEEVAAMRQQIADLTARLDEKDADVNSDEKSGDADDNKGDTPDGEKAAPAPANKSRTAATK